MSEKMPQVIEKRLKPVGIKSNGRPWFSGRDEGEVLAKLETVWTIGGTDKEACCYANISEDALYRYLKKNKDLRKGKEQLKENPKLKARTTIYSNMHDAKTAQWFLERKASDEFGNKTEVKIVEDSEVVRLRKDMKSLLRNTKNAGKAKNDSGGKAGVPVSVE
jgi:hypothetical protein